MSAVQWGSPGKGTGVRWAECCIAGLGLSSSVATVVIPCLLVAGEMG